MIFIEFQRLHGMGETLHEQLIQTGENRSRIYAPEGAHKDFIGVSCSSPAGKRANSSFIHRMPLTKTCHRKSSPATL